MGVCLHRRPKYKPHDMITLIVAASDRERCCRTPKYATSHCVAFLRAVRHPANTESMSAAIKGGLG